MGTQRNRINANTFNTAPLRIRIRNKHTLIIRIRKSKYAILRLRKRTSPITGYDRLYRID